MSGSEKIKDASSFQLVTPGERILPLHENTKPIIAGVGKHTIYDQPTNQN